MTRHLASLAFVGALLACGGTKPRPPLVDFTAGAGGAAHAGAANIGGSFGGTAGDTASASGGAAGALEPPAVCGDGTATGSEPCDGADLRGEGCESHGFEIGALACHDCAVDTSGCSGIERCSNGRDDDGDGSVDCDDPDCAAACASSCAAPIELKDPSGTVHGVTTGHASDVVPSCLPSGLGTGPSLAYHFRAATGGVVDATLVSTRADLSLSARTECASAGTERGCSEREAGRAAAERLRLTVTAGDELVFLVAGTGEGEAGSFDLDVRSRPIACGDGDRDPGEECDDGNNDDRDGCSSKCRLESDEREPNDSVSRATPYGSFPFIGAIADVADVDVYSIDVEAPNTTLYAETFDLGDGACVKHFMDTAIDVFDTDGVRLLGSDDDGGPGYCSSLRVDGLAAGTYFVRVRATGEAADFPYALNVGLSL